MLMAPLHVFHRNLPSSEISRRFPYLSIGRNNPEMGGLWPYLSRIMRTYSYVCMDNHSHSNDLCPDYIFVPLYNCYKNGNSIGDV